MKDVLIIIVTNIPALCFIGLSGWMMHTGTPGYGWAMFAALCCVGFPNFKGEINNNN